MNNAAKKNRQIANSYYNLGLEKAGQRDLSGAAVALKRCIQFNKTHTDARNLLGLVYNEIGEVGEALAQWVISLNIQEADNLAEEYLRKIHAPRGYLEAVDQAAKKYNQALIYAQNDNEDLAVLLLMRMVTEFPHYVKAQTLLALLYIQHEDFTKAGRCLYQVQKVDRYNVRAQRYMALVKENTGRAEIEKRKLKNAFSHRQMQDDDIIIPPSYKENTGWQSILNILAGLAMGAAVIFFLVLPASKEALNANHNQEMQKYLSQINEKSIQIDGLEQQMSQAKQAQDEAESSLASMVSDSGGILSQYQILIHILQAYRNEDKNQAALLYADLDASVLNDGVVNDIVAQVQQDMTENGWQLLMQMGDAAMEQTEGGGPAQALDYYQKSMKIKGEDPQLLYLIGMAYVAMGNTDTANEYFGNVIMNYADSEYAEQAKTQRGY